MPWLRQIEKIIAKRTLLASRESILVAVSGGLDSMVLLHVLVELSAAKNWKLSIAHFNHQLRGRSSDADEKFVRKTAEKFSLPIFVGSENVKAFAQKNRISIEMAARKLRHEFLAKTATGNRISKIALAHHADDQVELFFLRILRGSGAEGLRGMKWKTRSPENKKIEIIRPLLGETKAALEKFATENQIPFREDASNASVEFQRNRIRHELLPTVEKIQPAFAQTMLRSMEILADETDFISATAHDWLARRKPDFSRLHPALQRRVLQMQLIELGISPEFELIEQLRATPDRVVNFAPEQSIFREKSGALRLKKIQSAEFNCDELSINLAEISEATFGDLEFSWEFQTKSGVSFQKISDSEFFDADKIGEKITLRYWRAGDRFCPIGMKSPTKLQDLFVNMKIPAAERRKRIVAVAENGLIFWVNGLRISEKFKLERTTKRQLIWSWKNR